MDRTAEILGNLADFPTQDRVVAAIGQLGFACRRGDREAILLIGRALIAAYERFPLRDFGLDAICRTADLIRGDEELVREILPYVLVRTRGEGLQIGWLADRQDECVRLLQCRRLRSWRRSVLDCSDLARDGASRGGEHIFSARSPWLVITESCSVFPTTELARQTLEAVPSSERSEP